MQKNLCIYTLWASGVSCMSLLTTRKATLLNGSRISTWIMHTINIIPIVKMLATTDLNRKGDHACTFGLVNPLSRNLSSGVSPSESLEILLSFFLTRSLALKMWFNCIRKTLNFNKSWRYDKWNENQAKEHNCARTECIRASLTGFLGLSLRASLTGFFRPVS